MTSSETSPSIQDTAGQSFFGNIMQRIRNLRSGPRGRASTTSLSSLSSRCSSIEDVKQNIDEKMLHGEYRMKCEVLKGREWQGQRCGEECRYYQLYQEANQLYQEANQLYQEAKLEGEQQHKRADEYERAWKLSEDSVRQLQGEHMKNRDLSVIVGERDQEIVVLQRRVQDLHEDLDEEMAKKQTDVAGPRMTTGEPTLAGSNGNRETGEVSQMMATLLKFFQDERQYEKEERERQEP